MNTSGARVAVDMPAAAPAAPAAAFAVVSVPMARARASLPASRGAVAKALFVLGCAAAALALFGMTLNTSDSAGFLGPCAPTAEEAADLRSESKKLLLSALTQVFGATLAVVVPSPPLAVSAAVFGLATGMRISSFVPALLMCHLHGAATIVSYWTFIAMMWVTLVVSAFAAALGGN